MRKNIAGNRSLIEIFVVQQHSIRYENEFLSAIFINPICPVGESGEEEWIDHYMDFVNTANAMPLYSVNLPQSHTTTWD